MTNATARELAAETMQGDHESFLVLQDMLEEQGDVELRALSGVPLLKKVVELAGVKALTNPNDPEVLGFATNECGVRFNNGEVKMTNAPDFALATYDEEGLTYIELLGVDGPIEFYNGRTNFTVYGETTMRIVDFARGTVPESMSDLVVSGEIDFETGEEFESDIPQADLETAQDIARRLIDAEAYIKDFVARLERGLGTKLT